jgi:hypothetical protein
MHVPSLLERVRIAGLNEMYLVMRVDHEAAVADLLPVPYGRRALLSVPFLVMEAVPGCGTLHSEPDGHHDCDACAILDAAGH